MARPLNAASPPAPPPSSPERLRESAHVFLGGILARLRQYGEMPLSFDPDIDRLTREAWNDLAATHPESASWSRLAPELDAVLAACLPAADPAVSAWCGAAAAAHPAIWVRQLQAALRRADALGLEAVAWRIDGYPARETARRLGVGERWLGRLGDAFHAGAARDFPVPSAP
jgi:hypothetical protein